MREVVLKLTSQKDVIKHQSQANTFGQLKKELKQIKWSGMRVVERASRATLQMDDAILPQGDFLLFLVPEKVKSGRKASGGTEELSKPIEDCSYNECRSHMSWLNRNKDANLKMSGGTADLQKELKKYYKKNPAGASASKPEGIPEKKSSKVSSNKRTDEDEDEYQMRLEYEKKLADVKAKKAAKKEKAEKEAAKKKEKKGFFGKKKKKEAPALTDPIEIIEESRDRINKAVDQIVLDMIENGGNVPKVLQYTIDDLEKEIKDIHRALKTSRSNAKYIE